MLKGMEFSKEKQNAKKIFDHLQFEIYKQELNYAKQIYTIHSLYFRTIQFKYNDLKNLDEIGMFYLNKSNTNDNLKLNPLENFKFNLNSLMQSDYKLFDKNDVKFLDFQTIMENAYLLQKEKIFFNNFSQENRVFY